MTVSDLGNTGVQECGDFLNAPAFRGDACDLRNDPDSQQPLPFVAVVTHTVPISVVPVNDAPVAVSVTHIRAHETVIDPVCRLLP